MTEEERIKETWSWPKERRAQVLLVIGLLLAGWGLGVHSDLIFIIGLSVVLGVWVLERER